MWSFFKQCEERNWQKTILRCEKISKSREYVMMRLWSECKNVAWLGESGLEMSMWMDECDGEYEVSMSIYGYDYMLWIIEFGD